jgi:hypothetical protein
MRYDLSSYAKELISVFSFDIYYMDKRLTLEQYNKWKIEFYKKKSNLRFGQAFINGWFPGKEGTNVLYYMTDPKRAENWILRNYVEE